jgi:acetylornithine deacetylase
VESGVRLGGELILATHSLHEAPVGHMEGLKALIARGDVFTDAALAAECGYDSLDIRGKGQALFEIEITRSGEVLHENVARPMGTPNPLDQAARLAMRLLDRNAELAAADEPLLGPETFFLGQVHGGDFYNRVPTRAFLNGTHRFWPDKTWGDVEDQFARLIDSLPQEEGLAVDVKLLSNGLGWQVSPQERIVGCLREAYRSVVGRTLPLTGALSVCDVNVIVREAGIPAVAHGTGTTTAHADLEWVAVEDIVRTTRVFIATIAGYLGLG